MHKIHLENCVFYAYHGFYKEETKIGGRFRIDLTLTTDFNRGKSNDDLQGTVDYSKVYQTIKQEMGIPSQLLEHVGGRIVKALFAQFSGIKEINLKLCKLNPPIKGEIAGVSIEIQESR